MISKIKNSFFQGDARSVLMKKNIVASFLVKGWSCIVQLLLIPITLKCLNQYEYGIWITINSVLIWIDQMDIGLGNGLRNKLAESLALNDKEKARRQVSTAFIMLCLIVVPIIFVSILLINNIDCYSLLNVDALRVPNLEEIMITSFIMVGATFVFKLIGNVYLGLQLPAINNLLIVAGQTLALVIICILTFLGYHSLYKVAVAYTISPLIVYLIAYPITFRRYKYLSPSITEFDKKELYPLLSLGIGFFFIQIAGLAMFASSNVIISNILSPAEVTPYQIAYRYFSLVIVAFTIISAPLWTATTDAYTQNDKDWIKSMIKKMRKTMVVFAIILLIMLIASRFVYHVWIGSDVEIPLNLSVLMTIYIMLLVYSTCYSNMLFGIGKLKVITIVTVFEAIVYIPLAFYMGKAFGTLGIVASLIVVNLLCAITNRVQFSMLINGKAHGIWNK